MSTTIKEASKIRELIRQFEEKRPEIVFEWKDSETEAEGWLVINTLRNGAAGGGTHQPGGRQDDGVQGRGRGAELRDGEGRHRRQSRRGYGDAAAAGGHKGDSAPGRREDRQAGGSCRVL